MRKQIIIVPRIQRRADGAYFVYLPRKYKDIWERARQGNIQVLIRIEVPD